MDGWVRCERRIGMRILLGDDGVRVSKFEALTLRNRGGSRMF